MISRQGFLSDFVFIFLIIDETTRYPFSDIVKVLLYDFYKNTIYFTWLIEICDFSLKKFYI